MFGSKKFTRTEIGWLIGFIFLKLLVHFLSNQQYGLHRDEFLYLDEGQHLGWGFLEVPPFTPFIGWLATALFGEGIFVVRLFPALAGAVSMLLVGLLVREFGGKKWAIILACTAYLLSPAFLRSNTLFQPVCFNQMWWLVSSFILVRLVNTGDHKYWYWLGIAVGLGWLTKYSIAFFIVSMLLGLAFSRHRKWFQLPFPWLAASLAFLIALPNLLWQYDHNFPVVHHMAELAATQLVNVSPWGFLKTQLRMQYAGVLIWLPGLIWLFTSQKARPFSFLGWGYLFLMITLILLSGKAYYALGIYPVLMAAGGAGIELVLTGRTLAWKGVLLMAIVLVNLFFLPLGLPVLPVEKLKIYCEKIAPYGFEQRWEDGKVYTLPQDYADMHGWEELAAKVAKKYHSLPPIKQENCLIWGGGYSHASSLNYYRRLYDLPEVFSLNSSYQLWAIPPDHFDNLILVDDVWADSSSFFYQHEFVDSVRHPNAREKGYIFYRWDPRINLDSTLSAMVREAKERIGR